MNAKKRMLLSLFQMISDHRSNKNILVNMAVQDFKLKYIGSTLGVVWAFLQPTALIGVFWFIFQVGFKSAPVNDIPYILYFIVSIIPWFFFSEAISSGTNGITDNGYLVKKVVFPIAILPTIKVMSALFIHLFFICVTFFILLAYGFPLNVYMIQVFYYLLAAICLVVGMTWITSSIMVFFKDTSQLIAMMLQFGFWLTPIFWNINMMPEKYRFLIKLLPMYYITEGYRNSMLYGQWFWEEDLFVTITFWGTTALVLLAGAGLFKRLSAHFADVI